MTKPHPSGQSGAFIWYELMVRDPDRAQAFYGEVLGWKARTFGSDDQGDYRLFTAGDGVEVAGLMALPEDNDCQAGEPGWVGYIGVDDPDAMVDAIVADGGQRFVPPTDIPGVGRFAVVADPQGAVFTIMRGASEEASRAWSADRAGHCRWNELATSDPKAAEDFYARHFGWTKGEAMPMGELGDYQMLDRGEQSFGAVMRHMPGDRPNWLFYFGVEDIDAALTRVTSAGGAVLHGPQEIPGGEFIVAAQDPEGARFAVVGPRGS